MARLALVCVLAALLSCDGTMQSASNSNAIGSNRIVGKIAGTDFNVAESAFVNINEIDGSFLSAAVMLSDTPDLCERLKKHSRFKNEKLVVVTIARTENQRMTPLETGEYKVQPQVTTLESKSASVWFFKIDGNGKNTFTSTQNAFAKSGVVHLGQYAANSIASGAFDLLVGDTQDKIVGNFDADFCEATSRNLADSFLAAQPGPKCIELSQRCSVCRNQNARNTCEGAVDAASWAHEMEFESVEANCASLLQNFAASGTACTQQ